MSEAAWLESLQSAWRSIPPPEPTASVDAPGAAAAAGIAAAPKLHGARLIALEDGRVLGFGGDQDLDEPGQVVSYDPTLDVWRRAKPAIR